MGAQFDAARLLSRGELRRQRASLVAVLVVAALTSAIVVAAANGAVRTGSVLDRFLDATNEPAGRVSVFGSSLPTDPSGLASITASIRAVPGVEEVATSFGVVVEAGTTFDTTLLTSADGSHIELPRPAVVSGRFPAADAANEVAVSELVAADLDVAVGDTMTMATFSVETFAAAVRGEVPFEFDGPVLELDIVGVVRDRRSLSPRGEVDSPLAYASESLSYRLDDIAAPHSEFQVSGDVDEATLARVTDIVSERVVEPLQVFATLDGDSDSIRGAFQSLARGLMVLALICALAGLVAFGLTVLRHLQQARVGSLAAESLGLVRWQMVVGWALPVVGAAVLGTLLGALSSILLSPLFPLSIARRAELQSGVWVDRSTFVWVVLALLASVVAIVVLAATGEGRRIRRVDGQRPTSPSARWWSRRAGWSPPVSVGVASVWAVRRVRGATSPLTAIFASVLAVGGVTAVGVVLATQDAAVDDASRFGVTWDSEPDYFAEGDGGVDAMIARLAADDRLAAVGRLACSDGPVLGVVGPLCAIRVARGSLPIVLTDGRAPASPDEIALGGVTASRSGVQVGDDVQLESVDGSRPMRVTGIAVIPAVDTDHPGQGGFVTEGALLEATGAGSIDQLQWGSLVLGYPQGADRAELEAALAATHPELMFSAYSSTAAPSLVVQLGRLRPMLLTLAAFVAALGAVGAVHFLLSSAHRRRHETAILRSIGFVRRQVRTVITAQSAAIATVGLIVGLPVGLIIGRWVWLAIVGDLGMLDTPVTPAGWMVGVVVVFIVGSMALAWWPARRSAAGNPATALRGE